VFTSTIPFTGGRSHVTDVSNASRTMLFNIHKSAWDQDILRIVIPASLLPGVRASRGLCSDQDPR
jgi:glycerol kinase